MKIKAFIESANWEKKGADSNDLGKTKKLKTIIEKRALRGDGNKDQIGGSPEDDDKKESPARRDKKCRKKGTNG